MSANIALSLCIAFVIYLIWMDRRDYGKMPKALWLPLIWLMYSGSRAISYWIDPANFSSIDAASGNPIDRVFLSTLIAIGVVVLWRRKADWRQIIGSNKWIFVLFLYLGISLIWSDYLDISFKRWTRAVGDLVMALIVVTEGDPLDALRRMLLRCSFVLIPMSVVLVKYFHEIGVSYNMISGVTMWVGVTTHKNQLGQLACITSINAIWQIFHTWKKKDLTFYNTWVVLFMSLWLLNGPSISVSKTSILIFIICLALLIISGFFKNRPEQLGRYFLVSILVFGFLQLSSEVVTGSSLTDLIITSSGRDTTLTGRTDLWQDLLKIAANNPVFGVGYGAFWISDTAHRLWFKYDWIPESAHNGYIDIYLELGGVGLLLMAAVLINAYKNITTILTSHFDHGRIRFIFFVLVILYNITESSLTKTTNLLWFLFLISCLWGGEKSTQNKTPTDAFAEIKPEQESE